MSNCYIDRDQIQKIDIINIKGGLTANQVYAKYKPDYFMLENVKNFEISKANEMLKNVLEERAKIENIEL